MLPRPSRTLLECPPSTARSHFQAHQHSHEYYLLKLVSTLTCYPPSRALVVPKHVALALTRAAQRIWWLALSPEVERHYIDDADTPGDWALVDVEPDEIENHAVTYVHHYRSVHVFTLSTA